MSESIAVTALKTCMSARMPAMLVGPPGVGKTAAVREIADDMGYEVITLIGAQLDPTDVKGLPKGEKFGTAEDGKEIYGTVDMSPWWQVRILREKKIILFLDEFSNTPGATRAAFLVMLQNREFPNGQKMPDETIVIGAMNPTEEAADGFDLDYPTTNRITFLEWTSPVQEWMDGMLRAWGRDDVSDEEMSWRKKIVAFIEDSRHHLQKLPTADTLEDASPEAFGIARSNASASEIFRYAWSSRRSWDNLARILAHAPKDSAVQDRLMEGTIGFSSAYAFREWLKKVNDGIDFDEIFADPASVDWGEMSTSNATLVMRELVERTKEPQYKEVCFDVLSAIAEQGKQGIAATYLPSLIGSMKVMGEGFGKDEKNRAIARLAKLMQKYQGVAQNS